MDISPKIKDAESKITITIFCIFLPQFSFFTPKYNMFYRFVRFYLIFYFFIKFVFLGLAQIRSNCYNWYINKRKGRVMSHKIFVFMAVFCMSASLAFAENLKQVVTSEVFYDTYSTPTTTVTEEFEPIIEKKYVAPVEQPKNVPVWPMAGSDADFTVVCEEPGCGTAETAVVSRSGATLIIENNINTKGTGWSGGPSVSNVIAVPAGFDYECANNAEMPLMHREMLEDDGGTVLAVSRSPRKNCNKQADSYAGFAERAGFAAEKTCNAVSNEEIQTAEQDAKIPVNEYTEQEAPAVVQDQVRSWVVVNGQTLREVLQSWCDKEGWDLVWTTAREYPIEASAVFKGRFVDVASALVRNFERATPIPYAKFYKGNRVIVVSTNEE